MKNYIYDLMFPVFYSQNNVELDVTPTIVRNYALAIISFLRQRDLALSDGQRELPGENIRVNNRIIYH